MDSMDSMNNKGPIEPVGKIQVYFGTFTSDHMISLNLSPTDTVLSIKCMIRDMYGMQVERQHYMFCSRVLANHCMIKDYGIGAYSTVFVVYG